MSTVFLMFNSSAYDPYSTLINKESLARAHEGFHGLGMYRAAHVSLSHTILARIHFDFNGSRTNTAIHYSAVARNEQSFVSEHDRSTSYKRRETTLRLLIVPSWETGWLGLRLVNSYYL